MQKVVILPLFFFGLIAGQEPVSQNEPKITEARFKLGQYEIVLLQKKQRVLTQKDFKAHGTPTYCSASIEIRRKDEIIDGVKFSDIWPLGWHYGIHLPFIQESAKHFISVKYGDYDNRTFVITDGGELFDLGGGRYRIFLDRFLVSQRELPDVRESGTFTIFDLHMNKVLLSAEVLDLPIKGLLEDRSKGDIEYDFNFFTDGPEFFAGVVFYDFSSVRTPTRTNHFFKINLESGEITEAVFDEKKHKEFIIDFSNIDLSPDCECQKKVDR